MADAEPDSADLHHLPYGRVRAGERTFAAVRVGGSALDLARFFDGTESGSLFAGGRLEPFLAAGRARWREVRAQLLDAAHGGPGRSRFAAALVPLAEVEPRLPFAVADYVDFYASRQHAENVGRIFRPGGEPLTPNWEHLPIGYHGRAGTVVVSGTPVRRPEGQSRDADGTVRFGPSRRLDLEAEVGFVVGAGSELGTPVPVDAFREHVFGVVLLNDWSARDLQAWEYVPLGPFLGKSFATSIAAWITPLDALDDAWVPPPPRTRAVLPYLDDAATPAGLDITLGVEINGRVVSRPPFAGLYWSSAQMLAHLTVNGASLRTGDLYGSGTVSGPRREQYGSLLELTANGTDPVDTGAGPRGFLADGDVVVLRASAPSPAGRLQLAEVSGRIVGAAEPDRG